MQLDLTKCSPEEQLLAMQKSNPEFSSTKIIIVSGVVNESEIESLLKAGAEDFVKKPFSITELIAKISEVLQLT